MYFRKVLSFFVIFNVVFNLEAKSSVCENVGGKLTSVRSLGNCICTPNVLNVVEAYICTIPAVSNKNNSRYNVRLIIDNEYFDTYSLSINKIEIECINISKFNALLLPRLNSYKGSGISLSLIDCPLPSQSAIKTINKLNSNQFTLKNIELFINDSTKESLKNEIFDGTELFLRNLTLVSRRFLNISKDLLNDLQNLEELKLVNINILQTFFFLNNFTRLKSLSIENCQISKMFRKFNQLKVLSLKKNGLINVTKFSFDGLNNLQKLTLRENQILYIEILVFANLFQLRYIDLSHNKLSMLNSNLFENNSKLEIINLSFNLIYEISDFLFTKAKKLNTLLLSNNNLTSISGYAFHRLDFLKKIDLSENKLTKIPTTTFTNLFLDELDLNSNKITEFPGNIKTEKLNLKNNNIRFINLYNQFQYFAAKELNVANNKIDYVFCNPCNYLQKLDLSSNRIITLNNLNFNNVLYMKNLKEINLSFNYLTKLDDFKKFDLNNLQSLNCSHNLIHQINVEHFISLLINKNIKIIIDFSYNNISTVLNFKENILENFDSNPEAKIDLTYNPIKYDCFNYKLMKYAKEKSRTIFQINLNTVSTNNKEKRLFAYQKLEDIQCPLTYFDLNDTCISNCSCYGRPFDHTLIFNCSRKNLHEYPVIPLDFNNDQLLRMELHLQFNNLIDGPTTKMGNYDKLSKLYLSHNKIKSISWLPPNLKVIHLDHNKLTYLSNSTLKFFNSTNLKEILLNDNQWNCSCEIVGFASYLHNPSNQMNGKEIFCKNSKTPVMSIKWDDYCLEKSGAWIFPIIIASLCILLVILVILAIYLKYKRGIKIWLFAHNLCTFWVYKEEVDSDKTFDAFLCYSHKDASLIEDHLVPFLEEGPNQYKLCLHMRDWIPGEFISKQVTDSVYNSRRTIIVLSDSFVESVWGKIEFQTAHSMAMNEGRTRIIIILYGKINKNGLDNELKSYLNTNTYLEWGEPFFWSKLKYAMLHRNETVAK